jgi:hypothetical protein
MTVEGVKEPVTLVIGNKEDKKGYYAESNALPGDVFLLAEKPFDDLLKDAPSKYFGK